MSEKCGLTAKAFFNSRDYDKNNPFVSYENHYNTKLNKCFIVVNVQLNPNGLEGKELFDVNENKRYASFIKSDESSTCNFLDKRCENIEEWDWLVKPYMIE